MPYLHQSWMLISILALSSTKAAEPNLFFIQNKGQWDSQVLYLYRQPGLNAWITKQGVVYDFYELIPLACEDRCSPKFSYQPYARKGHVISVEHVGAATLPQAEGEKQLSYFYGYFLGNNPSRWVPRTPLYEEVQVRNIYPGIAQRWYVEEGRLRYDYIVSGRADPSAIRLRIQGALSVQVQGSKLQVGTRFGAVEICDLKAYQVIQGQRQAVPINWQVVGNEAYFQVGSYDRRFPLVIDPYVWSRLLGGSEADNASALLIDAQGRLIVGGATLSPSFPTTPGAYDTSYNGEDCFVTVIDTASGNILYSTFIGGSALDRFHSLVLRPNGEVCAVGWTTSSDFPTVANSYTTTKPAPTGDKDAFLLCASLSGNPISLSLAYSTFIGGNNIDEAFAVAADADGDLYVTGLTWSSNFPTKNAYDNSKSGTIDAFVLKINPAKNGANDLIYSTFLGGSNDDYGYGIATYSYSASMKIAYVVGQTSSSDFPTVPGSYLTSSTGLAGRKGFIVALSSSGNSLSYGSYLGGNNFTSASKILATSDDVYIIGETSASNFPTTSGSFDASPRGGNYDLFVVRLLPNPSLPPTQQLVLSTVLGIAGDAYGLGIARDRNGNIYGVGKVTGTANFPVTPGSVVGVYKGNDDGVAFVLNARGNQLLYGTYLGDDQRDEATAITVDERGDIYVAGSTRSPNFPRSSTSATHQGNSDVFVMRIRSPLSIPAHLSWDASPAKGWWVYPVPSTTGSVWIENTLGRPGQFELWDMQGRQIGTWTLSEGRHELRLPAGAYQLIERSSLRAQRVVIVE
ncbi:MAG: SBBP repeat-containing protein [Bacteroidia bacterium]|nr:SBBP repeat-containing protein [Bacteroidia bacterium]